MMSMEKSIRGSKSARVHEPPATTMSDGDSRRATRSDSVGSTGLGGEVYAETVTDPEDIELDSFRMKSARMAQSQGALVVKDGHVAL